MSDVAEILESWIERHTGSGQLIVERCPFCDARSHLYVDARSGLWICFRCEAKGDLVKLYAELAGISIAESLIEIKSRGIRRTTWKPITFTEGEEIEIDPPDEFIPCYNRGRWSIPRYLSERGVSKDAIRAWRIGYCNAGRYRNRIVIPFRTGAERSFVARAAKPGMMPPYLGPKIDEGNGRRFLPGWQFVTAGDPVIVCEGVFDALRIWQAGLKPLALLGKGLGRVQLRKIVALAPSRVVVMLDADAWRDARRITSTIAGLVRDVRIVALSDGDPGERTEAEIVRLVESAEPLEVVERRAVREKLAAIRY